MEFVDGAILRDAAGAEAAFDLATRAVIGDHMAETLARLHDVDVEAAGLGGLARHEGYVERQLRRWRTQYEQMQVEGIDDGGLVGRVGDELAASIPRQQRVVGRARRLPAGQHSARRRRARARDTRLGDLHPRRSVGRRRACSSSTGRSPRTRRRRCSWPPRRPREGFATRDQVLAAYARHSDLDLTDIAYYRAFGYWKLACILQGVFARYQAGATAGDQGSVAAYPTHIATLARSAKETLEQT